MFFLIILGFFAIILVASVINAKKVEKEKAEKRKVHHERLERQRIKQGELDKYRNNNPHLIEFNFAVKGLYYRNYNEKEAAKKLELGDKLKIIWDKGNKHDYFALKVITIDGVFIGFVDAKIAEDLWFILDDIVDCVVSKIDNKTDLPFIYAEAYFDRQCINKFTFEDSKKFIKNYCYTLLTSRYYTKEFKIKKTENVFFCENKLKENHPRMNANYLYADTFAKVLDRVYDNCNQNDKADVLLKQLHYQNCRENKLKITIDDWMEVIDYCEYLK